MPVPCRTAVAKAPNPMEAASQNASYPAPGEHPPPAPWLGQTLHPHRKTPAHGAVLLAAVARLGLCLSPRVPHGRGGRAAGAMPQEERSCNELLREAADETAPRVARGLRRFPRRGDEPPHAQPAASMP